MKSLILPLAASVLMAAADAGSTAGTAASEQKAPAKSIVPSKYAGKYKGGGSDELAEFIKSQCTGKEGFEFPAFFTLCRKNGLAEEQVSKYESQVNDKVHGAAGRARMTLRNMLATIARKEGKLKGIDGKEHDVNVPKAAVSGAAAKQAEASEGKQVPAEKPATNGKKK